MKCSSSRYISAPSPWTQNGTTFFKSSFVNPCRRPWCLKLSKVLTCCQNFCMDSPLLPPHMIDRNCAGFGMESHDLVLLWTNGFKNRKPESDIVKIVVHIFGENIEQCYNLCLNPTCTAPPRYNSPNTSWGRSTLASTIWGTSSCSTSDRLDGLDAWLYGGQGTRGFFNIPNFRIGQKARTKQVPNTFQVWPKMLPISTG